MSWIAVALTVYLALGLAVYLLQDSILFPGAGRGDKPLDAATAVARLQLATADGTQFRVVEAGGDAARAVLLFFVGNGEDLRGAALWANSLARYGLLVVAIEYPGYGASGGRATMASIHAAADAAAAHAHERARRLGVPLFVGGSSLGTFCAMRIAATGIAEKCLLRAPPTSIAAVAAATYWWLPVRLLLRHPFDNLALAPRVRCPVLIVHGTADQVVPAAHGRALRAAIGENAALFEVEGYGHNDLFLDLAGPAGARVRSFLAGQ